MENTDEILWKGIMDGDMEKFLQLYRRYYHSLLFIGLSELKDADLVKDTIQQQFLYLWEKRNAIQEASSVKNYLVTSFLRRLSSDWKRSQKKYTLEVAWNKSAQEQVPTPEEKLIIKDEHFQVNKLLISHINALPARQKELVMLKFYEGLSYEEIVLKTGLTHRTVYNKIYEALKTMKLNLEQHPGVFKIALSVLFFAVLAAASAAWLLP